MKRKGKKRNGARAELCNDEDAKKKKGAKYVSRTLIIAQCNHARVYLMKRRSIGLCHRRFLRSRYRQNTACLQRRQRRQAGYIWNR